MPTSNTGYKQIGMVTPLNPSPKFNGGDESSSSSESSEILGKLVVDAGEQVVDDGFLVCDS